MQIYNYHNSCATIYQEKSRKTEDGRKKRTTQDARRKAERQADCQLHSANCRLSLCPVPFALRPVPCALRPAPHTRSGYLTPLIS